MLQNLNTRSKKIGKVLPELCFCVCFFYFLLLVGSHDVFHIKSTSALVEVVHTISYC